MPAPWYLLILVSLPSAILTVWMEREFIQRRKGNLSGLFSRVNLMRSVGYAVTGVAAFLIVAILCAVSHHVSTPLGAISAAIASALTQGAVFLSRAKPAASKASSEPGQ